MIEIDSQNLPEGVRVGSTKLLEPSLAASEKVLELIERGSEGPYLRVAITGGGCNGLTYKTKFTDKLKSGDILVAAHGAVYAVDSKSALYLKGTTLDYSKNLIAGGFKFENPNAKSSCSCGDSFGI